MNAKKYKKELRIFKDYIKVPTPMKEVLSTNNTTKIEKIIKEVRVEPFTKSEKFTDVVETSKVLKKPFQDTKKMLVKKTIEKEITKIEVRDIEKEREIIDVEANIQENIYLNDKEDWVKKIKEKFVNTKSVKIKESSEKKELDLLKIKEENLKEVNGIFYKDIEKEIEKTRIVKTPEEVSPLRKTVLKERKENIIQEEYTPILSEKYIETVKPTISVEDIATTKTVPVINYVIDKNKNIEKGIYQKDDNKWYIKKTIEIDMENQVLKTLGGFKKVLNMQSIKDNNLIMKDNKCFYIEHTNEEEIIELMTTKLSFPFYKKVTKEIIELKTIEEEKEIEIEEEYEDIEIKYKDVDKIQLKIVKKPIDDKQEIDFARMQEAGLFKFDNANKIEDVVIIGGNIETSFLDWGSLNKIKVKEDKTIINKLMGHFQSEDENQEGKILTYKTEKVKIEISNTGDLELFNDKYLLLNGTENAVDILKIKIKKGYTDSLTLNIKKTDLINIESINNMIFALVNQNSKNSSIEKEIYEIEDFIKIKLSSKSGEIIKDFWITVPEYMNNILVHSIEVVSTMNIKMPFHFKNEKNERIDNPTLMYKEKPLVERIEKIEKKVSVPYEETVKKTRINKVLTKVEKEVEVKSQITTWVIDEEKNKSNNIYMIDNIWYADMLEEYSIYYKKENLIEVSIPTLSVYEKPEFETILEKITQVIEVPTTPYLKEIEEQVQITDFNIHMYEINKIKIITALDTDYIIEPVEREKTVSYTEDVIDFESNIKEGFYEHEGVWYKNKEHEETFTTVEKDILRVETPYIISDIEAVYKEIEFKDFKYNEEQSSPIMKTEKYIEQENFEIKEMVEEIIEVEEMVNFTNYREETILDIEEIEQIKQVIDYKRNEEEGYYLNEHDEWVKQDLVEVEKILSTDTISKEVIDTYKIAELGLKEIDGEYYIIQDVEEEVLVYA